MVKQVIYINFEEKVQNKKYMLLKELLEIKIFLTPRELDLFYYLYTNKNIPKSVYDIKNTIWENKIVSNTIVYTYINYLIEKFKKTKLEGSIVNIKGFGYKYLEINPSGEVIRPPRSTE